MNNIRVYPTEVHKLIHVSAGLGLDGGGAALVGRLFAQSLADYCARRRFAFEVLHLGMPNSILGPIPVTHFKGNQLALALKVWQTSVNKNTAIIYDHIGPARTMGILPAFIRPRYALMLHGIEVWKSLSGTRERALKNATLVMANSNFTEIRTRSFSPWLQPVKTLHLALE